MSMTTGRRETAVLTTVRLLGPTLLHQIGVLHGSLGGIKTSHTGLGRGMIVLATY